MATTDTWDSPALDQPINADLPAIKNKFQALVKGDPSLVQNPPVSAKRLVEISGGNWQLQQYNGSTWGNLGKLQMDVDTVDGYHAAITPAANTVAVRNASGLLQDSITGNAATASSAATLSQTLPVNKGGTGATTSEVARANLGVPPTSHASTNTTHGVGNATQYGHLKLSDATNSSSGVTGGVAATPAAVKAAVDGIPLASASVAGLVKIGTNLSVSSGTVSVPSATPSKRGVVFSSTTAAANTVPQAGEDGTLDASWVPRPDCWDMFPPFVPVPIWGVTFGGSDGRRAVMPGETVAREDWILCDGGSDGKGGTVPDLRGRMIRGASDSVPAGSTGGSEKHSHSLSGTVGATTLTVKQLASHAHGITVVTGYNGAGTGYRIWQGTAGGETELTGGSQPHTHALTGASGEASSLPPYYTLAYIMRCA